MNFMLNLRKKEQELLLSLGSTLIQDHGKSLRLWTQITTVLRLAVRTKVELCLKEQLLLLDLTDVTEKFSYLISLRTVPVTVRIPKSPIGLSPE